MGEANERERAQAPWIKEAILLGQRYHVRTKSRLAHNTFNLGVLSLILSAIVGVAILGAHMPWYAYLPWAPFAVGLLYFAAFILVVHEASHEMFVLHANKALEQKLNRIAGWMVAPFFATHYGKHWERGHIEHHVRPMEPNDPQGHNTVVGRTLFWRVVLCVFVPGFLIIDRLVLRKKPKSGKSSSSKGVIVAFVLLWVSVVTVASLTLGWASATALPLGINVIVGLNHIKGALEHGGALRDHPDAFLRSRSTFFFGRHILMPLNITLHFEHHLNYRVPWYDLMRYHHDLRDVVPPSIAEDVWNDAPLKQLRGKLGGVRVEESLAG